MEAAQQLVYGPAGSVATKGQALMHESCGSASFCHSSKAEETKRQGAPYGMNFDMLPSPIGLGDVFHHADGIWTQIDERSMPPSDYPVGEGLWTYSRLRSMDEPRLPKLQTREGRAIMRNWLACGSPVVTETMVPGWAQSNTLEPVWSDLHPKLIASRCATPACHDSSAQGGLVLTDACKAREALLESGNCKKKRLVPGDVSSFLIEKVSSDTPSCGTRMPTGVPLAEQEIAALRQWVADGALAPDCP
jgi:hypothetical protein